MFEFRPELVDDDDEEADDTRYTQGTGGDEVRTVLWHFIFSCGLRETLESDNRAV